MIRFNCPKCDYEHVEKAIEAQVTSVVHSIRPNGIYLLDEQRWDMSTFFRCAGCGYPLIDDNGPVNNPSRLIRWIKEQDVVEREAKDD